MIKEATILDIPDVICIGHELYEASINHNTVYDWDDEEAIKACKYFVTNDDSVVFIAKEKGFIAGFFIGQLIQPIASKDKLAIDVMFFVRPECQGKTIAVRLIKKYEQWAKEKGAKYIQLGVSSGLKQQRTLSMYSLLGYKPQAVTYFKEV